MKSEKYTQYKETQKFKDYRKRVNEKIRQERMVGWDENNRHIKLYFKSNKEMKEASKVYWGFFVHKKQLDLCGGALLTNYYNYLIHPITKTSPKTLQ